MIRGAPTTLNQVESAMALDTSARDLVAAWPPLTRAQRELLASLLAPMRDHIAQRRSRKG